MKLDTLEKKVRAILEECPKTRGDDNLLYLELCRRANPVVLGMNFASVLGNLDAWGIPHYDSVRRTRQRIQEHNIELKASAEITDKRYEKFKEVLDYVTQ